MIKKQPELYAFLFPSKSVSEFYYNDNITKDQFIYVKIKTVPRKRLTIKFLKSLTKVRYYRFTRIELEHSIKHPLIGCIEYKR